MRSSGCSSPAWTRKVGPGDSQRVAERMGAGSARIMRLSKPPQLAPMPNSSRLFTKPVAASGRHGFRVKPKRPEAPVKSRRQMAWPGSPGSAGQSSRSTSGRPSSHSASRRAVDW